MRGLPVIPLMIILIVASLLAWLFRDFLREEIVVPLLYAYWLVRLYLESLPQALLWGIFIGLALWIILRSWRTSEQPRRRRLEMRASHLGAVEAWAERIRLARRGEFFKKRLARRLSELMLNTLAYRTRQTTEEIKDQLGRGELKAPVEIQTYLQAGLGLLSKASLLFPIERSYWGRRAFPLDLAPERAVRFLEEQLSISSQKLSDSA